MPPMRIARFLMVAVSLAACASAQREEDKPARPVKEIVSGGARVRGGGMRMDVQIGRPFTQPAIGNGTVTAKPNAAVAR